MRELTIHGIEVSRRLRAMGYRVLEVHPSSTLRLLGLSMGEFIDGLATILRGPLVLSKDEADSLVAAYTCYLAYLGLTEEIHGLEGEGYLVIPRPGLSHPLRAFKCVVARGLDDGCW
jgi:predicted nuclease with RNAse H fold